MKDNSNQTIGIVGGGQLGRMTLLEARRMAIPVHILTPQHPSPASDLADRYLVGSLYDSEKILQLAEQCDVISFEIEHIDVETLKKIEASGKRVAPSSRVLEIIQDKSVQKGVLRDHGLPVSNWDLLTESNTETLLNKYGYPVVQKACKGGYDGKGVFVLKGPEDLPHMIKAPSFFEEHIPFQKEIAVMVARNGRGETKAYPMTEMEFDPDTNICDITLVPSPEGEEIQRKAQNLALKAVEALEGEGIFGVEMFLTKDKEILINEIAPRPHNSGHYTIEGCITSQYEQYIRAIMNLPLGSTELIKPNVMVNLLGAPGFSGDTKVKGLEEALKIPGVFVHIYGKQVTKPYRKMGHITALADTVEEAMDKAVKARKLISIEA